MKFKKGTFYIRMNEEFNYGIEKREGWISEDGRIGFHKSVGGWLATDIASGLGIGWEKTRAACVKFLEENAEGIERVRKNEKYQEYVDAMAYDIETNG